MRVKFGKFYSMPKGGMVAKSKVSKPLQPTPAEGRLLRALWMLGEATVEQIVNSFPEAEQPNYKTAHTFLRIMEVKGFVRHRVAGKVFIFEPIVSEHEVATHSVNNLLTQSFGGSPRGLLINLIESDALKANELREIEELIRKYRKSKESKEEKEGD